jgi:transcriptional regulator with XRE-family HTH domain
MSNLGIALGETIAQRRKNLHLTQEELAERAGISQQYLSDLERGARTNVSWDALHRIAQALGTKATVSLAPITEDAAIVTA